MKGNARRFYIAASAVALALMIFLAWPRHRKPGLTITPVETTASKTEAPTESNASADADDVDDTQPLISSNTPSKASETEGKPAAKPQSLKDIGDKLQAINTAGPASRAPSQIQAQSQAKLEAKAALPARGCFTYTYRHRPTAGHTSREKCGEHANLVQLGLDKELARLNAKSICVRIDGTPVHYERIRDLLLIGPIAGPSSVIQVHYCLGKARCSDPCKVPQDPFMASIGAGADEDEIKAAPQLAKWDPSDKDEDRDVTAELDAEFQEAAGGHGVSLFKGWVQSTQAPGCGLKPMASTQ